MLNVNDNFSNANPKVDSETSSKTSLEAKFNFNNNDKADLVSRVLATEADKSRMSKNKKHKSYKSDVPKQATLFDKIF